MRVVLQSAAVGVVDSFPITGVRVAEQDPGEGIGGRRVNAIQDGQARGSTKSDVEHSVSVGRLYGNRRVDEEHRYSRQDRYLAVILSTVEFRPKGRSGSDRRCFALVPSQIADIAESVQRTRSRMPPETYVAEHTASSHIAAQALYHPTGSTEHLSSDEFEYTLRRNIVQQKGRTMQAVSKFIFGPSQEERVKKVQSQLRTEQRALDREMRQIDQGSTKTKAEIKKLAKKGDVKNAKILAREVVRAQKQKNRLAVSKARLNSINMQLQHQLAMYKVTGSMQKSTEIMKLSNQLVKLPEVSAVMRQMSAEMTKAGIMEELMEDALDSGVLGEDEDEMEEEAQDEVDKVLYQLTDGKLGQASTTDHLPDLAIEDPKLNEEQEQQDMQRMQAALDGLLRG
ncbi:hypothetical protein PHSY_004054 [Pseudozyma hubeiensis SY62]|uniref:Uncharacterized protein n=1 Tax=Pseudozyma hubeiensis (strain SY62) TaxID=1305764 RepID=R9P586_PSEHS|nr:hypothetical protein PHSY_004054 [Pseudozyma hubeiensis SY62]GAC96474.1 hypothetical protein PHSY_004054 [Pseudozyma hubeiensis SY62]